RLERVTRYTREASARPATTRVRDNANPQPRQPTSATTGRYEANHLAGHRQSPEVGWRAMYFATPRVLFALFLIFLTPCENRFDPPAQRKNSLKTTPDLQRCVYQFRISFDPIEFPRSLLPLFTRLPAIYFAGRCN